MKVISIDRFDGGRNTLDNQLLIDNNQCASGSINVWAPNGALTKMPGYTELLSITGSGTANSLWWMFADDTINASYQLYYRIENSGFGANLYAGQTTENLNPLGYTTGTISISGATKISATGHGTSWSSHVSANDLIEIAPLTAAEWKRIASVEDNTHLTLAEATTNNYTSATGYTALQAIDVTAMAGVSFVGSLWMVSTANLMQRYNGTGILRVSAAPKAAFLEPFQNYLFAARTPTAESRLYWSNLKDPTSWGATDFVDIDKDNGKISGLRAVGPELIVFKTRGMFKVVGDIFDSANPTYAVYPISVPKGFLFNSNNTAAVHDGRMLFYSHGNIYAYESGTSYITRISDKFSRDLPTAFSAIANMSGTDQAIYAASFNGYYILKGLSDVESQSKVVIGVLDRKGAWWIASSQNEATAISPFGRTPMVVYPTTSARPRLLIASDASAQSRVYTHDFVGPTYEDQYLNMSTTAKIAIDSTWISKEFNVGFAAFKHAVIYLEKQSAAGNLAFAWSIDQGSFTSETIDMTKGRGNMIRRTVNINQRGSTIQVRIKESTADVNFKIFAVQMFYEPIPEDRQA